MGWSIHPTVPRGGRSRVRRWGVRGCISDDAINPSKAERYHNRVEERRSRIRYLIDRGGDYHRKVAEYITTHPITKEQTVHTLTQTRQGGQIISWREEWGWNNGAVIPNTYKWTVISDQEVAAYDRMTEAAQNMQEVQRRREERRQLTPYDQYIMSIYTSHDP